MMSREKEIEVSDGSSTPEDPFAASGSDSDYEPIPKKPRKKRGIPDYFNLHSKSGSSDVPASYSQTQKKETMKSNVPEATSEATTYLSESEHSQAQSQPSTSTGSTSAAILQIGQDHSELDQFKRKPMFDGTFFTPLNTHGGTIVAKCVLCISHTLIRGPVSSTSNFLKHLKKKHPGATHKYKTHRTRKVPASPATATSDSAPLVQTKITHGSFSKKANQAIFDNRLIKFVAETMSPISIIEHESFKNLFKDFNINVMTRKTFSKKIKIVYDNKLDQIKKDLLKCDFVCTTADIWSAKKRSFIGVTCHWIEKDNFVRKSAALACERFSGAHTFNRIAEQLHDIFTKFDLDVSKNVATVTDNGSNFVKSFKEFGLKTSFFDMEDPDREEGEDEEDENPVTFVALPDENETPDLFSENLGLSLPRHLRCASHTLNLLATTDVNSVINSNSAMRLRHTNILKKCSDLWKYASKPKSAEVLQKVLGHSLSYPTVTRWNSFFDSINQILAISKEDMKKLCDELQMKEPLKEGEVVYLQEYCAILKPIAETLDFLQGENNTYFGYVIPSITSLRLKLRKVKTNMTLSRSATSILDHLIRRLDERFDQYLDSSKIESKEAIIAAVTCPNIKLKWLTQSVITDFNIDVDMVKEAVIHAGVEIEMQLRNSRGNDYESPEEVETTGDVSFFEFESEPSGEVMDKNLSTAMNPKDLREKIAQRVQLHLLQYLEDKRTALVMLNEYEEMKALFMRYNTILPSSAPVERLFSFAGMINSPKRQNLSDEFFQMLVILKANGIEA